MLAVLSINISAIDIGIIILYFLTVIMVGLWVSKRGSKNLESYFLGGKSLPWYILGISDAGGMFDISGTMVLVTWLFMYGLKSIWLPWVWPTFNQIFLMMFLSAWLRRSNVLTGAEWIKTRFGQGLGANLAHISVVFFALVAVVGMLAYAFKGIGKFAVEMLPWRFGLSSTPDGLFCDANIYALILMGLTSLYTIKGGMISVVITEVLQFSILTITSLVIGGIAIYSVSPSEIQHLIPAGWTSPFFGATVGLDWTGVFDKVNLAIRNEGNEFFGIIFGLMLCKGVLASIAGPMPNYDMQRILATRNPREACMMNGWVTTVLMFPRYMMVAGLTVMALKYCTPELQKMDKPDFESLLPIVVFKYMPVGVVGFLLAGLFAAFMSNFAATVNAAPAYIVNDIYKRYINPNSPPKTDILMSRISSVVVLACGLALGLFMKNIFDIMWWIVGSLNGAYVIANVLKWLWWRFNGHGYFWGMVTGIFSAMFVPELLKLIAGHGVNALYTFPIIFAISAVGCFAGALLTKPEDDATLKKFYKNINPWGFWGPIREKVCREDPKFKPNHDFAHDMLNVAVGMIWQLCLASLPIFIVLRNWKWAGGIAATLLVTVVFLKFNWYDKLDKIRGVHEQDEFPESGERDLRSA
jgi:solute:Na+ symporter, SSS family